MRVKEQCEIQAECEAFETVLGREVENTLRKQEDNI